LSYTRKCSSYIAHCAAGADTSVCSSGLTNDFLGDESNLQPTLPVFPQHRPSVYCVSRMKPVLEPIHVFVNCCVIWNSRIKQFLEGIYLPAYHKNTRSSHGIHVSTNMTNRHLSTALRQEAWGDPVSVSGCIKHANRRRVTSHCRHINDDPIHPAGPNKRCSTPTWSTQTLFHNLVASRKVLHIQLNGTKYVLGPKTTFHRLSRDSHSSVIC
jgi:hypothetical protein